MQMNKKKKKKRKTENKVKSSHCIRHKMLDEDEDERPRMSESKSKSKIIKGKQCVLSTKATKCTQNMYRCCLQFIVQRAVSSFTPIVTKFSVRM